MLNSLTIKLVEVNTGRHKSRYVSKYNFDYQTF